MGAAVPQLPAAPPDVSIARLHGEACWHCGAVNTTLATDGAVTTTVDGGLRVWQIVTCPQHRSGR